MNLNDLAMSLVGDGESPNMFFVSSAGNVFAVFHFEGDARQYARMNGCCIVEDRLTGVVWEKEL